MHKCFKCGTEFEGKFCPECGTQWQEEKTCPQCGATLAGGAKFCNECGYSFAEAKQPGKAGLFFAKVGGFFKKVWGWVKSHLKIVIPTAAALIAVIVVCSLIPTFIVMGVNGTYYAYSFDENGEIVFSEKNYITLSTGKWTDSDGNEGTYSRSGKSVTLKYHDQAAEDFGDIMGDLGVEVPTEQTLEATVENGVLIIKNGAREEYYVKKNHEHEFGEWEVTKEPTCTEEGEQKHTCVCKKTETEVLGIKHGEVKDGRCVICGQTQLRYVTNGYGYKIKGFAESFSESENVEILSEYEGLPVIQIGSEAFKDCMSLKSVTIPDSVTSIEDSAFENCRELTSVIIPDSIMFIGDESFKSCSKLTNVTIPNSISLQISSNAFLWCDKLIQTEKGVQYVDKWVIDCDEDVKSVTLRPNTVGIAALAFECCGIENIKIPNSVININHGAFENCYQSTENGVYYADKWVVGCDWDIKTAALRSDTVGIAIATFANCRELTSVTIPDSVTNISDWMFSGCSNLTSVTIPNSVTYIGHYAFQDCSGLTSITIPDSVTSIGDSAFAHCSGLTSITIPDSVTSIGYHAFNDCSPITSIRFNGTKTQWKAIRKKELWSPYMGYCVVQCTDGKLDKDENEIE